MNKNYQNIQNSEENEKNFRSFYISAKQKLQKADIKGAYYDFEKAQFSVGCAYCKFLSNNIDKAYSILYPLKNSSPFVDWLLCLCNIFFDKFDFIPTYFQIRNFYENTLDMLIMYKNFDYAKKILMNINYFAQYNLEVYKYSARVFINNGMLEDSIYFLKKSIDYVYNDPEIHYMLADVYMKLGNKQGAKKEFQKSNEVSSGYYPAQKMLDLLSNS